MYIWKLDKIQWLITLGLFTLYSIANGKSTDTAMGLHKHDYEGVIGLQPAYLYMYNLIANKTELMTKQLS